MAKKNSVVIVYGNHGRSPAQLEDYHGYLMQSLKALEYDVLFSEEVVAGQLNLLIECFDTEDVQKIIAAKKQPGTRFICIATEFITQHTFNDFEINTQAKLAVRKRRRLPRSVQMIGTKLFPILFPEILRALFIDILPGPYFRMRERYYSLFGYPQNSIYAMKTYWRDRHDCFFSIADHCEAIWCVTPHQMPEYTAAFGTKVALMPVVSWTSDPQVPLSKEKDIDFLFTGSITPYRKAVFDELRAQGYTVFTGPATLPSYLRDHYISRAKVCLQVRQDANWKYPSIMRYHYLLCAGSVIVAEKTTEHCNQESFLTVVSAE